MDCRSLGHLYGCCLYQFIYMYICIYIYIHQLFHPVLVVARCLWLLWLFYLRARHLQINPRESDRSMYRTRAECHVQLSAVCSLKKDRNFLFQRFWIGWFLIYTRSKVHNADKAVDVISLVLVFWLLHLVIVI